MRYIWDILDGEKYTDKQTGEEKTAWKNYGWLFYNEEKDKYSVKIMWKFFNVFPKKENIAKPKNDDLDLSDIAF
jgi:hypothetical protein